MWPEAGRRERIGLCFLVEGWVEQAAEQFRAALAREPGRPAAAWGLARALLEAGRVHEAVEQAQQTLATVKLDSLTYDAIQRIALLFD